jgi:eukaryotic-like serine/threonine-protein kinase
MSLRLELLVSDGTERGRTVLLTPGTVIIGSAEGCDVRFPDASVAPRHAEVTVDPSGAATIRDLTGQQTVRINGLAAEGTVAVGSFIRLGAVELVLRTHGESGPHGTLARASPAEGGERTVRQATPHGTNASSGSVLESIRTSGIDRDAALASTTETKAGAPLQPGEVISQRYRILEPIAAGGMGEVYRAEHVELGKLFAVKVMRPHLSQDKDFVARFKREAVAASAIGNINIIDVSDFGQTGDGRFYFAMEHLAGDTLAQVVESHGAQSVERTLRLCVQVARALAAAHAKGIIHRDLKPENVMVLQDRGQHDLVKVLDFGVAKVTRAMEPAGQTTLGVVVGTPQYMSPEQASGLNVDARSDIYALGLILYELLTGRQPFTAPTAQFVMSKQIHEAPPPLASFKPDLVLPRALEGLVMDMLAKAPAARPQSMTEVVQRLEAIEKTPPTDRVRPSAPRPQAPAPSAPAPVSAPRRSLVWVGLGTFVGAVALGVVGVLGLSRETPPPPEARPTSPPVVVVEPKPPEPPPPPPPRLIRRLVESKPPGALVREADVALGTTPLPLEGAVGATRTLTFTAVGHQEASMPVSFDTDAPVTVTLVRTEKKSKVRSVAPEDQPVQKRKQMKGLND